MDAWQAFPPESWRMTNESRIASNAPCGIREFRTSYAVNTQIPQTLNGTLSASLTLPEWRTRGSAGLIVRASAPWSFICCYLYSFSAKDGQTLPVISTYHQGVFQRVAVASKGLRPRQPIFDIKLHYQSARIYFRVSSDNEAAEVEANIYQSPLPGLIGVIRHYDCWASLENLNWSPLWHLDQVANNETPAWEWDVFISYPSSALEEVRAISGRLSKAGLHTWVDYQQIKPGDNVVSSLEYGLRNSRIVLAVINKGFLNSGWCRVEYSSFINAMLTQQTGGPDPTRRIVPLLVQGASLEDAPFLMRAFNALKYPSEDWEERLREVL